MSIQDRKQREREQRNTLILDHADELLKEHGYLGLNLDQLADRIEYAKATIYNHFISKEDLMVAVATRHLVERGNAFSLWEDHEGRSREKMCVIGVADKVMSIRYPHAYSLGQLVATDSIWQKASPENQQAYQEAGMRCMRCMLDAIRYAEEQGDLSGTGATAAHLVTGLVSLSKGAYLMTSGIKVVLCGLDLDPVGLLSDNFHILMDGAGWHPLSTEFDYKASESRIRERYFSTDLN